MYRGMYLTRNIFSLDNDEIFFSFSFILSAFLPKRLSSEILLYAEWAENKWLRVLNNTRKRKLLEASNKTETWPKKIESFMWKQWNHPKLNDVKSKKNVNQIFSMVFRSGWECEMQKRKWENLIGRNKKIKE